MMRMKLFDYIQDRRRLTYNNLNVANLSKNHGPYLDQLDHMKSLPVHSGCVNTIEWNKTGEYILSGSDDKCLCITRPMCLFDKSSNYTVLQKIQTTHLGNIFSAKFLPNTADSLIASCSSNGPVIVTDVNAQDSSQGIFVFNCHTQSIYDVVPVPDEEKVFLSCSDDSTVRLFDLRCHRSCSRSSTCPHPPLIRNSLGITKIALHPLNSNLLLVGRADGKGLLYDRRKLPNPAHFSREASHAERIADPDKASQKTFQFLHPMDGVVSKFCVPGLDSCRFTSLCFSALGDQILASYTRDDVYLFNYDKTSLINRSKTFDTADPSTSTGSIGDKYDMAALESSSGNQNPDDLLMEQARRNHAVRTTERRTGRFQRIALDGDWPTRAAHRANDSPSDRTNNNNNNSNNDNHNNEPAANRRTTIAMNVLRELASPDLQLIIRRAASDGAEGGATNSETTSTATTTNNNQNTSNSDLNLNQTNEAIGSGDDDDDLSDINLIFADYDDADSHHDQATTDDVEDPDGLDLNANDSYGSEHDDEHDPTEQIVTDSRISNDKNNVTMTRRSGRGPSRRASLKRKTRETPPPPATNTQQSNLDRGTAAGSSSASARGSDRLPGVRDATRMKFRKATEVLRDRYKDIPIYSPSKSYFGHRNRRTIIKQAEFWGDDYIMSGSDCGRIFFWEKKSGEIVLAFKADSYVVNRLSPNPHYYALASSGIDYDIKLWSTQFNEETPLKPSKRDTVRIIESNEAMLDEMMSTLTVPPSLFFRFLATLSRGRLRFEDT